MVVQDSVRIEYGNLSVLTKSLFVENYFLLFLFIILLLSRSFICSRALPLYNMSSHDLHHDAKNEHHDDHHHVHLPASHSVNHHFVQADVPVKHHAHAHSEVAHTDAVHCNAAVSDAAPVNENVSSAVSEVAKIDVVEEVVVEGHQHKQEVKSEDHHAHAHEHGHTEHRHIHLPAAHSVKHVVDVSHASHADAHDPPQTGESKPPVIIPSIGAADGAVLESRCIYIG
jgi:hypothetical protein